MDRIGRTLIRTEIPHIFPSSYLLLLSLITKFSIIVGWSSATIIPFQTDHKTMVH